MFFVILVFVSHYMTAEKTIQIQISQFHLSLTGITEGMQASLRLIHVIALGFLFIATTRTNELKHAAGNLLKHVPLIPEKKAALMLSLMLRFLPEILNITKFIMITLKSRCLGHTKNPVRKIKYTVIPVMRGALRKADTLVMAMESRCFTDQYRIKKMKSTRLDQIILSCVMLLCLLITGL